MLGAHWWCRRAAQGAIWRAAGAALARGQRTRLLGSSGMRLLCVLRSISN